MLEPEFGSPNTMLVHLDQARQSTPLRAARGGLPLRGGDWGGVPRRRRRPAVGRGGDAFRAPGGAAWGGAGEGRGRGGRLEAPRGARRVGGLLPPGCGSSAHRGAAPAV